MDAAVLPPWTRRFSPKVQISSLVWVQKRCAWAPEMGALSQVFRVISIVSRLLLCLDAMSATSAASDCWLVKCWFLTACEVSDYAVVTFACLTLKPSQCAFGVHQLRNLCIWLRMGPSTTAGPHTVRGLCVGRAGSFKHSTLSQLGEPWKGAQGHSGGTWTQAQFVRDAWNTTYEPCKQNNLDVCRLFWKTRPKKTQQSG